MFRKILKPLVLAGVLAALAGEAQAEVVTVYLGQALNQGHCLRMAGSAGYPQYIMGGYVNGVFRRNACFGVFENRPLPPTPPPVPPGPDYRAIEARAADLSFAVSMLGVEAMEHPGYASDEVFRADLERLRDAARRLMDAAQDRHSLALLARRFERVAFSYDHLEGSFFRVHDIYRDRNVLRAFDQVEVAYVALDEIL